MTKLYNVDQIATQLNISVKVVRNKIYKIGLKKVKTKEPYIMKIKLNL